MKSSRSIASSSWTWLAALAVALAIVLAPGLAEARRRVVVLEFTGPKAEEFQEDVEKLLKKSHSLVPRKKWEAMATKLKAVKINEKNVKKVAAKLQVDGVLSGKVEKRGSRYYLHLQLREGSTGKTVAAPDIVERNAGLGPDGRETIASELMPIVDDLDQAGGGDDEEEDEGEDEEEEEEPRRSGFGKSKGKGKGKAKPSDDEEEEEEDEEEEEEEEPRAKGKGKGKGKGKAVAKGKGKGKGKGKARAFEDENEDASDDEESDDDDERVADSEERDGGDDDEEDASIEDTTEPVTGPLIDPRVRAMDVAAGLSFTGRRLSFQTNLTSNRPQGYKGNPVPGIYIAADIYPLAFNKKNRGFKRNLGVSLVFDRVIKISSNLEKMNMVYDLPTTEQHYAAGLVYRQPIGDAMQVEGSVRYNRRKFAIDGSNPALEPGDVDIPSTSYTYVDPGLALKYVMSPKMVVGGDARFLLITDTGAMQNPNQYGGATVTGIDIETAADYSLGPKLLVRAALRLTTIGFAFKGNGNLTNNRDNDPSDTDVSGARDTYFGGFASGVYLF